MVTNHVYTIAGAKGGVGKTTTSINLGTLLAEAGYSTVVVEMDLAMANLVDFLDIDIDTDEDATFHDVLAGDVSVTDAMYEADANLSVVPSGTTLGGYADTDIDRLADVVETLRWHHDIVLLDTPAGLSEETVRPLELADDVLLVSTPRVASIRNVSNTKELAERVDAPVRGLVLTKSGTGSSPGAGEIADFLGVELLGHVPEDDAVPHAQDNGTPAVLDAPNSGAAIAYKKISRQLVDTGKASARNAKSTGSPDGDGPLLATVQPGAASEPGGSQSVEATDGGHAVETSATITDDSDLLSPSQHRPDIADGPPLDRPTPPTDAGESATREDDHGPSVRTDSGDSRDADAEADVETESTPVIDGSDLAASDTAAADAPAQHASDEAGAGASASEPAAADSSGASDGSETEGVAASGDTDENGAAESDAGGDGLGARMRSLFGL